MVKKKAKKQKKKSKKKLIKKKNFKKTKKIPKDSTLNLKREKDIAMDFAVKAYKKFDKIIKSIVLFGSVEKNTASANSDIDIVIILDDASIKWTQELIAWYRTELEKLMQSNPYNKEIHLNTIKLTTWWEDLLLADPTVLSILRHGEALIDFGGFFEPLKYLLIEGKIKPSPETIYNCLQRAPEHLARSRLAELSSIEGLYWAMVDSAHGALIAAKVMPPSPEHIVIELRNNFVNKKMLHPKYVEWFKDLTVLHKKISHREIKDLKGVEIDMWQNRTQEFIQVMTKLVDRLIS